MTQEQINTLRQDITNVTRQIQILSGPEFADTVPEVATAKTALERYKQAAEEQIAAYEAANRPAQPAVAPATAAPGQINIAGLTAAIQSNSQLGQILGALLQAAVPAQGVVL